MVPRKILDNSKGFKLKFLFLGFKIEFICFQEYPSCKLTRQKRWPLGDLLLQKNKPYDKVLGAAQF